MTLTTEGSGTTSTGLKLRFMSVSLWVGLLITTGKFYAFYRTGSAAVFSDALESIVNILGAAFGLYAIYYGDQPKDSNHPYGHGKIEFMAAGFEGGLITLSGLGIITGAVYAFIFPKPLEHLGLGLLMVGVGLVANGLIGWALVRAGKKHHSHALEADGWHLLTDSWGGAGLFAGLILLYYTHLQWLDPLIAFVMGGLLFFVGARLLRKSLGGLLDETDPAFVGQITALLQAHRHASWIDLHNLRVQRYGISIHIDCHVTLPYYFTMAEVYRETQAIEQLLNEKMKVPVEIFIHTEPCNDACCELCAMNSCPVRQHRFRRQVVWAPDNVTIDAQHSLNRKTPEN